MLRWFFNLMSKAPSPVLLGYTAHDRELLAEYGEDALNFCVSTPPEYR